jgi:hypothetical protein
MKRMRIDIQSEKNMFAEDILLEIDSTLEQLIRNSEIFQNSNVSELSETEINAFQKTQESLLHRFLFMDKALETKRKSLQSLDKRSAKYKIQERLSRFEKLKNEISSTIQETRKKQSFFAKRNRKRYLSIE